MLSKKDVEDFTSRIAPSLKIMNAVSFSDSQIEVPDINFYPDGEQYYDPNYKEIHIGIFGILELFEPESEEEYLSALNYIRGHEEQHVRSTADRPYGIAINKGCEAVVEYIQEKEDGYKRRFKRESEYTDYVNELAEKGIYISWQIVRNIISSIANCLEDGRIERIRSNRLAGFKSLCILFRGKVWRQSDVNFPIYENLTATGRLQLLINQILNLSTCQLYQKGFFARYCSTPLLDEVKHFMPHIAKAVMSGKTRGLIEPVKDISGLLAPYIYEVAKLSAEDAAIRKAFEEILKELISSMVDKFPNTGLSERVEDTDEGSPNTVFPKSDLVVTLDDDVYDKLVANSKKSDSEGGIMIKRKHPKEESGKKDDEKNTTSSKGSSSSKTSDSSEEKSKEKDMLDRAGCKSSDQDSESSGSSDDLSSGSSKEEKHSKAEMLKNSGGSSSDNSGAKSSSKEKKEAEENNATEKEIEKAEKAVLEAMKKAAEKSLAEAASNVSSVNSHVVHERTKGKAKEVKDREAAITPEQMKGICNFRELKRAYKVSDPLPAVLNARGKALRRKNEQYFKSLSTPSVSFLDSGMVDPSRIFGLAMGDTEVFRKKGKDKVFDGCAYILIDNSGSMSGDKRVEACKAAAVIEEAFKGILPFKIVAFDFSGCVIHEVVKGWEEVLNKNCCWNFCLHGREGCGNEDKFDIQIAEKELLSRSETKKLLIVLSDGAPGDVEGCRMAVTNARKHGIVVNSIYFEEGDCVDNYDFEYMYQRDYVCCPLSELDTNLQKIMKKFSRS